MRAFRGPIMAIVALSGATAASAQWTNRYPKVNGFGHHVYLEGYELPSVTIGPIDPTISPDGRLAAVSSRGWLWIVELATGSARRLTTGGAMDSRPAWSPDQRQIAFVRDDGKETWIAAIDVNSAAEKILAQANGIELDPAYSADGRFLYYGSAEKGDLDIWRLELSSGERTRITEEAGLELKPLPHPDGKRLVYMAKRGSGLNEVRIRDLASGTERVLIAGNIVSQARPALSPDGKTLAINWPTSDASGWDLRLVGVEQPGPNVVLVPNGLPLTPTWAPDGGTVYYVEADRREVMGLHRVAAVGGRNSAVEIGAWSYGVPTASVTLRTTVDGNLGPTRLAVRNSNGHPLLPDQGQPRFDGQTGTVFFYSPGTVTLTVPEGSISMTAVQGLATTPATKTISVTGDQDASLDLKTVWDARAKGWLAGEHHFHLNYGGQYRLEPDDLTGMALGEAMDVLTPLLANLHTRFEDQPLWNWQRTSQMPFLAWGQEVRSHFFGHIGLVGTGELFWPWIWGPGYEIYSRDDRPNRAVLDFGRQQGGMSIYVHPVSRANPFGGATPSGIPTGFVADAVQGLIDGIELACLWSDERGTADLWYRVLNLGIPLAPTAGTDVMNNLYRTMAVGTTRVYVRGDSSTSYRGYLEALKAGRSFVTTGPMLDFEVGGARPGDVLTGKARRVGWNAELASAVAVERLELIVNGRVVDSTAGVAAGASRRWSGTVTVPAGGWVALRAVGGAVDRWPAMDSYAFAHTAPIWFGARGSTDPATRRASANDLLSALDGAESAFKTAYSGSAAPAIAAHYQKARAVLQAMAATRE